MRLTDSFAITGINGFLTAFFLVLVSGAVVYIFYRNIYPPQTKSIGTILRTTRLITLILIGLQAAMLAVNYAIRTEKQKVVGILVDASKSMEQYDNSSFKELLHEADELASSFETKAVVKRFLFDSGLREFSFSSPANGLLTNISNSLNEFEINTRDEKVSSVILFSDGRSNQGEPPEIFTKNYSFPIHVIGVGEKEAVRDIGITFIEASPIVFVEDSIELKLGIASRGFSGRSTEVRLYDNGSLLEIRKVILPKEGFVKGEVFNLSLSEEREHLIKATLISIEDEATDMNNSRMTLINVLPKKKDILLLSGAPSPDYVFIRNILKNTEDVNLTSAVESVKGKWYDAAAPDFNYNYDVMIFIGYPSDNSPAGSVEVLLKNIRSTHASLYYIDGQSVNYDELIKFSEFLPGVLKSNSSSESYRKVKLQLRENGKYHPFTRQSEFGIETKKLWDELPPAYMSNVEVEPKSGAVVLLSEAATRMNIDDGKPILMVSEGENQKSAMLMAIDSYTFDMLLRGIGNISGTWEKTLLQGVEWLSIHDEPSRVNIRTDKQIYSQGENVIFTARVYDEAYHPMEDVFLQVSLRRESEAEEEYLFDMINLSSGKYSGEYKSKTPGKYKFHALAKAGEIEIGESSGEFLVEEYSLEFVELGRNETVLTNIAENTGGTYIPHEFYNRDSLKVEEETYLKTAKAEFKVWNDGRLMVIVLVLLAVEWALRKRGGLL